jgi:Ni/Co efflux regulator RcnB
MKKTVITAIAAFALAAPFAPLASAQPDYRGQQQDQYQGGRDGDHARGDDRARTDNDWNNGRGRDHRGRRHAWRDNRHDARWDDAQHNGYYSYNQWHYGPPRYMSRNVTLGYRPWARGQRLGYYGDRYAEVDYRRENLRAPRRGYHWVRDNDGDFLLAAIATGIILQVVLNSGR